MLTLQIVAHATTSSLVRKIRLANNREKRDFCMEIPF